MAEDKLTRDDLVLLMESYRNMIIMHQTILDQSSKMIDSLNGIAGKQDNLFNKQGTICSSLEKITEKLNDCGTTLKENIEKIEGMEENISDELKEVKTKVGNHQIKSIEGHGTLTNKIYIGWVGMGTIILGLIGLAITISKFAHTHPPM